MDNADAGSASETGAAAAATPTTPTAAAGGAPRPRAHRCRGARPGIRRRCARAETDSPASRTGSVGWVIGFIDVLDRM